MKQKCNIDVELSELKSRLSPLDSRLNIPAKPSYNEVKASSDRYAEYRAAEKKSRTLKRVISTVCAVLLVAATIIAMPASVFKTITPVKSTEYAYDASDDATELFPVAKSYDEIYDLLYEKFKETNNLYLARSQVNTLAADLFIGSPNAESEAIAATNAVNGDYSGTNVQVNGVDESDIVKTDGNYIYYLNHDGVQIVRVYDNGQIEHVANIDNINEDDYEGKNYYYHYYYKRADSIYLADDKLIVLSSVTQTVSDNKYSTKQSWEDVAFADVYNISDPENPVLERSFSQDGNVVSTRMIGNILYIISNQYLYSELLDDNEDFVPEICDTCNNNGEEALLDCSCISILPDFESTNYLITTSFDVTGTEPADTSALLGAGSNVYSSTDNLYVICEKWTNDVTKINKYKSLLPSNIDDSFINDYGVSFTEIIKYSLANGKIRLSKDCTLPGYINDQYCMDEYNGNFRIALNNYLFKNTDDDQFDTINIASLYILDEDLNTIGSLIDIAHDEEVKSVRYMSDKIYLVTFRQVDPLFVIDASDPTNPVIQGQLKVPGFSEYLHPYSDDLLIGIGYNTKMDSYDWVDENSETHHEEFETTDGVKLSLFDVSDPVNPKEVDTFSIKDSVGSDAIFDPKAFLFSKRNNLIGFPITSAVKQNNIDYETYAYYYSIIKVDENGFTYRGQIDNNISGEKTDPWEYNVKRGLYIGKNLYTISDENIVSSDLATLSYIDSVSFPKTDSDNTVDDLYLRNGFAIID